MIIECSICHEERSHHARGLCRTCHSRELRRGNINAHPHNQKSFRDRYLKLVKVWSDDFSFIAADMGITLGSLERQLDRHELPVKPELRVAAKRERKERAS